MNLVSLKFRGKLIQLAAPSGWNGITPAQFLTWIITLQADLTEEEKLRRAVPIFYSTKRRLYRHIPEHYLIQFAPTLRFLFEQNKLNKWLIQSFRHRFRRYYGPADKLSNLTAYEFFIVCEPLYWKYKATGSISTLNALVATLYRPKRNDIVQNDLREPLTDAGIAARAKRFASLPVPLQLAIVFNYEGCRNYIAHTHQKAFSNNGGGKSNKRGDITLTLSGDKLGDLEKTRNTNLYTFLLHLENLIEQEEKLKENL